jgi:serine/threonine-protein kinase RsbT
VNSDSVERLVWQIDTQDPVQAGKPSLIIKQLLKSKGFSLNDARRCAIAAYEAELNIIIHAKKGELLVLMHANGLVEIWATDLGPGIPDIDLAMQEGWSTATDAIRLQGFGAGMGLPNIKRNADFLSIESQVGQGTRVYMQFNKNGIDRILT